MKNIAIVISMGIAAAISLFIGGYIMFVGGIVDIIDQFKAVETSALVIMFALLKMIFAVPVGGLILMGLMFVIFCVFD